MVKCKTCRRKIPKMMIDVYTCKCGEYHCGIHITEHDCSYDHKTAYKELLKNRMPVSVCSKNMVDRI